MTRNQRYIERIHILCALTEPERQLIPLPLLELDFPELPALKPERQLLVVGGNHQPFDHVIHRESGGIIVVKERNDIPEKEPYAHLLEILRRHR